MSQPEAVDHPGPQFTIIAYEYVQEMNYLSDFLKLSGQQDYRNSELKEGGKNPYCSVADQLYKRIVKHGYISSPSIAPKTGKKKNKHNNEYSRDDSFIDDGQFVEKKQKVSHFSDYACLKMSIEELYASEIYRKRSNGTLAETGMIAKNQKMNNQNNEQDKDKGKVIALINSTVDKIIGANDGLIATVNETEEYKADNQNNISEQ